MYFKKTVFKSICNLLFVALSIILFVSIATSINIKIADAQDIEIKDTAIYALRNKATGYYLSFDNTKSVFQSTKDFEGGLQAFKLDKIDEENWNILVSKSAEPYAVDVSGDSELENTEIIIWQLNNNKNQSFRFKKNNDNSFKILTGSSNYEKCIGIENNGRAPGLKCVQMAQTNDTTSWYLEELWSFSYRHKYTPINDEFPRAKQDKTFGKPTLVKEEMVQGERMIAKSVFGTIKTGPCDMLLIRYWRYQVPINARVHDFNINIL